MAQPKIYQNLARLPERVVDRFTLYLQSPLHTVHQETLLLWQALRVQHPGYTIADEQLYRQAFPAKHYDNARLRILRNYLWDHLGQFLAVLELEQQALVRDRLLRRAVDRYRLPYPYKLANEPASGPIFWESDHALEEFWRLQDGLGVAVRQTNRGVVHDLHGVLQPLDVFYVVTRLKYLCASADTLTRQPTPAEEAEAKLIMSLYHALNLASQPLAAIYFHLLHLFLNEAPGQHHAEVRHLLQQHQAQIESQECLNIYTYWFNDLNRRHRSGDADALPAIWALYQDMIGLDIFFEQGSFSANHFRNIVLVGAMLGHFEDAHDFLERYHHRLQAPWRTGVYAYCKGYLCFAQAQYAEAKRQLMHVEFHDAEYKVSHQMLLMRIYYETTDLDGLESVRDALKIYLYRNKDLTAVNKAGASNFSRFTIRLAHLKGMLSPRRAAEQLLKEMQQCNQLRDRNWLYAKANEIMDS